VPKATTIRFADEVYARLDQASARTGMPVNSIVVAACLEWLALHVERSDAMAAPRWTTLRRAVGNLFATGITTVYPFEQFSDHAKKFLTLSQSEARKRGHSYIGTEHLLIAFFGDPEFYSAKVLARLGVERQAVEAKLDALLAGEKFERRDQMLPTERVKKIIELAFKLCAGSGQAQARVGTHHILLAVSKEGNGIAAHVLNDFSAPLQRIETEVGSLKDSES
jgi:hypothetical protein